MRGLLKQDLPALGLRVCCVLCAATAVSAAEVSDQSLYRNEPAEFTHDFRRGRYAPQNWVRTGPNAASAIRAEARGLRITLPAEHGSKPAVGVMPRLGGLRGNFEIMMSFEILRVDEPASGNGAGVSLWITLVSETRKAATILRLARPGGEQVFASHWAVTSSGENREHHGGTPVPTTARSGWLRLMRAGPVLVWQVAEGESQEFQEIYRTRLGDEDVDTIRFAADTGGSPTLVDAYIKTVTIRAEAFGAKQALPESRRWSSWLVSGIVLLVLVLAAGGLWLRWRS